MPPFQAPDEYNHFYRVYHISEGNLIPLRFDNRVGGYLPDSLQVLARTTEGIPFNANAKMDPHKQHAAWSVRTSDPARSFVDFNNTALMPFVPYLHQSVAVWVTRRLTDRTIAYVYAARLANLLFWIVLIYVSIRLGQGIEWLIVAVALMPTGLHLAASMSYDSFTIATCILFVAMMHSISSSQVSVLRIWQIGAIGITTLMVALSKFAYLPLTALLLFVPQHCFGSKRAKIGILAAILLPTLLAWLAWTLIASNLYINYEDYNPAYRESAALVPGVAPAAQVQFILSHPVSVGIALMSAFANTDVYATMIARTGWFDTVYPAWFLAFWCAVLGMAVLRPGIFVLRSPRAMKVGMALTATISALLLVVLLYMQWNPVAHPYLQGLQGRYLIPILLPALISVAAPVGSGRARGLVMTYGFAVCFVLSCGWVMYMVWNRYYGHAG